MRSPVCSARDSRNADRRWRQKKKERKKVRVRGSESIRKKEKGSDRESIMRKLAYRPDGGVGGMG